MHFTVYMRFIGAIMYGNQQDANVAWAMKQKQKTNEASTAGSIERERASEWAHKT